MRTIRISRRHVSSKALQEAVAVLRRGGTIVYPTETSYGIGADPGSVTAVQGVYAIKGRSSRKPLPVIAGSFGQAAQWTVLTGRSRILAKRYWPGPLTLVVPFRTRRSVAWQHGGRPASIAIRVPGSAWARALAETFGSPIVSTSANISDGAPVYSGGAVRRLFSGRERRPDLLLDAGQLPMRPPSTIVQVRRGVPEVLREGGLTIDPSGDR
ncbi:hypothetical protein AMJ57_00340 [Parcubacteria bacterium SG8_24]|nr:MAG: hypothetical protein AMJ57_00340 [Parcubacteria bacterium SG8_24]